MKKKLSDKELDEILSAYAKKEAGKYGTDEQMFADLKAHFAKEKEEKKQNKKQNAKPLNKKLMWISSVAAALVLILSISLIVIFSSQNDPEMQYIENLTQQNVTLKELNDAFIGAAILDIEDFELNKCIIFTDNNENIAYTCEYIKGTSSIIRINFISKMSYTSSLENYFNINLITYEYNNTNIAECINPLNENIIIKFEYNSQKFYIEFSPLSAELKQNIISKIIN